MHYLAQHVLILLLCYTASFEASTVVFAGSAIETAGILAVTDANEGANVEFTVKESAAAVKHNAAATVLLSAKKDGFLLSGCAT